MKKLLSNARSLIMGLFVISTFFVLPLFWGNNFTNLFIHKYIYYYASALIAIGLFLVVAACQYAKDKPQGLPRLQGLLRLQGFPRPQPWELALFAFTAICILSTLVSDFSYEAFWGNEGRYNGLFLMLLYCIPAYLIGRYLAMKQWYLDVLLACGMLVCLYGITDYFRMDILGAKTLMDYSAERAFFSTIGNINFYTSYVGLVVGCSAGLFLTEGWLPRRICYYVCYATSLVAIVTGSSDNAYLSLGTIWALMTFYALARKVATKRLLLLFTSSLVAILILSWINEHWTDRVIHINSLFTHFDETRRLGFAAILTGFLTLIAYLRWPDKGQGNPHLPRLLRPIWLGLLGIAALFVLSRLYDANIAGNEADYGSLRQYLVFNDQWGSSRGYSWRIAWEYFVGFSPLHKLLGYGLETYPILNIYNHKWEMAYELEVFFDSVHNEYLQYLIGIGILGAISYLAFFAVALWTIGRNVKKTPYLLGIVLALCAYWVQATVNISTVYVAAVMWALFGTGLAASRNQPEDGEGGEDREAS